MALLLATTTPIPDAEVQLANLFWDSCVQQKSLPPTMVEAQRSDLPFAQAAVLAGATYSELRMAPGENGAERLLVARATFVPARNGVIRRCVFVSSDWKVAHVEAVISALVREVPVSEAKIVSLPGRPTINVDTIINAELGVLDEGWQITIKRDGSRVSADYVRYTSARAQEIQAERRTRALPPGAKLLTPPYDLGK